MTSGRARVRRALDVAVAGGALVVLAPLLAVLAAAVRLTSPGPVLYRQARVGLGGRPFTLLKLRTMRCGAGGPSITPAGDRRVTPVGAWLRRTKLDELPQLVNVLRGDMSLIGPRPEVPDYLARIGETGRAYAAVRPGLADAATLAFYDEAARLARVPEPERYYVEALLPEKARLSIAYAAARTWRSDVRLLVALARRVIAGGLVLALVALAEGARAAGPLLVVAPHPDDEILAAGGIIVNALAAGRDVRVLVVTNGDDVRQALERFRPVQIVVTGTCDQHPDHRASYYAVRDAVRLLGTADPGFAPVVQTTIVHDPVTYPFDDFWRPGAVGVRALAIIGDDQWPNPSAASGVPPRFDPGVAYAMPTALPRTIAR